MKDMDQFVAKLRVEFLDEAAFLLEQCEESLLTLETADDKAQELAQIFRSAHTIKGSGAAVGFDDLVKFAHVFEDCLAVLRVSPELVTPDLVSMLLRGVDALKARVGAHRQGSCGDWDVDALKNEIHAATAALTKSQPQSAPAVSSVPAIDPELGYGFFDLPPPTDASASVEAVAKITLPAERATDAPASKQLGASTSIKVDAQRIDGVLDMVGELVVAKSQLLNKLDRYQGDLSLQAVGALLDTIVRDLQDRALSIRLTPLKPQFLKLQRIVRDLALRMGKKVELSLHGEDTEIDRTTVEMLADPLMHMVRNAIDHGIESVAKRVAAGKDEAGHVSLTAKQVGGRVIIEIADDGGGMPRERIVKKALERSLIDEAQAASMSDKEVYNLVFMAGFSTAEVVSDVSGRGVGMDVVKTNIERLKGTIEIDSVVGKGSTFTLSLPLTTSITDGILVKVRSQPYVIPMDVVRDLVDAKSVDTPDGSRHDGLVSVRGRVLPLIDMRRVLTAEGIHSGETTNAIDAEASARTERGMLVVTEALGRTVALAVEAVVGQMQVVQKPLSTMLNGSNSVSGAAIMGDGHVALILDVHAIVATAQAQAQSTDGVEPEALRHVA